MKQQQQQGKPSERPRMEVAPTGTPFRVTFHGGVACVEVFDPRKRDALTEEARRRRPEERAEQVTRLYGEFRGYAQERFPGLAERVGGEDQLADLVCSDEAYYRPEFGLFGARLVFK